MNVRSQRELPEALRLGRRSLDALRDVELIGEPEWAGGHWVLRSRLTIGVDAGSAFPPSTEWYVCVDDAYPFGDISFFPSRERGLAGTYWHQLHKGAASGPWTSGKICLSPAEGFPSRDSSLAEGFDASRRLEFHFLRALEWLRAASAGRLAIAGDHFELPDYSPDPTRVVAFCEDASGLSLWRAHRYRCGIASLAQIRTNPDVLSVIEFLGLNRSPIVTPTWGSTIATAKVSSLAGWIIVPDVPALNPWQAPDTWGELRQAVRRPDFELDTHLRTVFRELRDDDEHLLLLGCEVPELLGDARARMHWLPLVLPQLARKPHRGLRANEDGLWTTDRASTVRDDHKLRWISSENWAELDFGTRGRLPRRLLESHVLLLGAGALGAMVGELLARGGVNQFSIIDAQSLVGGNLLRHTLKLTDVARPKSLALAERLNAISPRCNAICIEGYFPAGREEALARVDDCNCIIDCTGSNDVIAALSKVRWSRDIEFWSLSIGAEARRAFVFSQRGQSLDAGEFFRQIEPWSIDERTNRRHLVREGIGCWHPVFPARADEVWAAAAVSVGFMAETTPGTPRVAVLERPFVAKELRSEG